MKRKTTKRSTTNKNHRSNRPNDTPTDSLLLSNMDNSTFSLNKVVLGNGTVHLDSYSLCFKSKFTLKTQKALKRDLLRCSDQRPSLLGPYTLHPPRQHHGSQQMHTNSLSSGPKNTDRPSALRRHSVSFRSHSSIGAIDRVGPWPDISISRLRSDGNELLRPLKMFRNVKNPRFFSPKYYAGLNEHTSKFKFFPSTRSYIEEYRKQKGYTLDLRKITQQATAEPLVPMSVQQSAVDDITGPGTFGAVVGEINVDTFKDRTTLSTTRISLKSNGMSRSMNDLLEYNNTPPSIPAVTKILEEPAHLPHLPTVNMRNGHLRPTRYPPHHPLIAQQTQHQQTIALPTLTGSSLHYISSMHSVEKAYSTGKKQSAPTPNPSRLYLVDGRQKKKLLHHSGSDSETGRHSRDYSEIRANGIPPIVTTQRSNAVVVYQLPRRSRNFVSSQSDVGPMTTKS